MDDILSQIEIIRGEVEAAANVMITAASRGLDLVGLARGGNKTALDELEKSLFTVLEAAAFEDLTGQRLTRLARLASGAPSQAHDPLLDGPADPGGGLGQAEADRILGGSQG